MHADHRALILLRAQLLFLAFLFDGTWSSRTHRLNVRTSDGATHTVSFGNSPAIADVDASRFCAKYGVLDDECSKLATSMKSVQAKSRDQWGMSISSPFEGSLVQVPGDLHVVVDYFFEKEDADPPDDMYVCVNVTSTVLPSGDERSERTCWDTAAKTFSTFFPIELVGYHLGNFELMQWGKNDPRARARVSFATVKTNGSDTAVIFDAYCNEKLEGSEDDPMSRRPMAFLNGELMFRSTGTSNPGQNFPGIWLPSAGIAPRWFLDVTSPLISFRDINRRQITPKGIVLHEDVVIASQENPAFRTLLRENALKLPMIDKRFQQGKVHYFCNLDDKTLAARYHVELNDTVCKKAIGWEETKQNFSSAWTREGLVDVQQAQRAGSQLKVQDRRYILDRFYSLHSMVVSIRLDPRAWRANGYWGAARHILRMASTMGIDNSPVVQKRRAKSYHGICEVNQFVHAELGYPIDGWEDFYRFTCHAPFSG